MPQRRFMALLAAGALLFVRCAPSVATLTHMNCRLDEHVTLEIVRGMAEGCGRSLLDFVRVLPDGRTERGKDGLGYRIPDGMAMVVTDVDWQYSHPKHEEAAGKAQTLRLFVQNLVDRTQEVRVFESTVVLGSRGEGGVSERMTSGFVVSSAARICPEVVPGPDGPPSGLLHVVLRGYFMPDTKNKR